MFQSILSVLTGGQGRAELTSGPDSVVLRPTGQGFHNLTLLQAAGNDTAAIDLSMGVVLNDNIVLDGGSGFDRLNIRGLGNATVQASSVGNGGTRITSSDGRLDVTVMGYEEITRDGEWLSTPETGSNPGLRTRQR